MDYEKIYLKNMSYLQKKVPLLFKKIFEADITGLELVEFGDSFNIKYNDSLVYPNEREKVIDLQVDNFLVNPSTFYHKPVGVSGSYVSKYTTKISNKILEKSPILYDGQMLHFEYFPPKKTIPFLILFGIGSGEYIEKILEKKNVLNLIIIEKDYRFLKLSMHLVDWTKIFEKFKDRPESFSIITGEKEEVIAYETINTIYKYNGMYTFYIQYLKHSNSEFFKNIEEAIAKNMYHAQTGWGFYEDEKLSLQHTLTNLKRVSRVLKSNKRIGGKVIVIGSGPSLDIDIDNIKEVAKSTYIISCGTSLRTLWKNGIKPDLHIEIERNLVTYKDLLNIGKEFLKEIILVGLNVLHPKVKTLFKESFLLFRDNDAGGSLFKDSPLLMHTNPTVVNCGVNLAYELGFSEIYLLGVDNGFKDSKKHHSKGTIHSDEESSLFREEMNYVLQKVKGNFVDEVYTTPEFSWSKQRIENCIISYNKKNVDTQVYNCGDGAYIKNTIPKKFDINEFNINHLKDLDKLYSHFKVIEHGKLTKQLKEKLKSDDKIFSSLVDSLCKHNDSFKFKNSEDIYLWLDISYQLVKNSVEKSQVTYSFLSGTLKIINSYIYSHMLSSKKSEEEKMEFINHTIPYISSFYNHALNMFRKITKNKDNFY